MIHRLGNSVDFAVVPFACKYPAALIKDARIVITECKHDLIAGAGEPQYATV